MWLTCRAFPANPSLYYRTSLSHPWSIRPRTSKADQRSPDERCMGSFPSRLQALERGWRLDALDGQGGWFAATVVEVRYRNMVYIRS